MPRVNFTLTLSCSAKKKILWQIFNDNSGTQKEIVNKVHICLSTKLVTPVWDAYHLCCWVGDVCEAFCSLFFFHI